jgi:RNA polymerase sigma factor (sigma-70 family)
MDDSRESELLKQFTESGSETAFATLVERHVSLVYSTALRRTANPHQAQEIAQVVFIIFARKASSLRKETVLSGWFYHTARLTAENWRRAETRRARREQEALMRSTLNEESNEPAWDQISPVLEAVMGELGTTDRDAVVLRYFENKSLREVGARLGLEERAAQKRVTRALEKLRRLFAKRGLGLTTNTMAAALSAHAVQAAAPGLAGTITATAWPGSAVAGPTMTLLEQTLKLMAWTTAKKTAGAAIIILVLLGAIPVAKKVARERTDRSVVKVLAKVQEANTGLPEAQGQAKALIFASMVRKKIPEATNWCETVNVGGKLWPATPTNITFALNTSMAGRTYTREEVKAGRIHGETVVFFESAKAAWNQAGGIELLPTVGTLAVALADGTAHIVTADEAGRLRWAP